MKTYITKDGDCWDSIAKAVYGSELKADVLMEANRRHIDTFMFSSGTEIIVPELSPQQSAPKPPWR